MDGSTRRRTLIALNGVLVIILGAVVLAPPSFAQRGNRARGEYTMVSGKMLGGNSHAVYIVDTSNQEIIAARWNEGAKSVDVLSYRDLQVDGQSQPGR